MENLHLRIKEVRENLKLSQIEFSNSLNISRSGIAQIEAGKTNPSFNLIRKIVKKYNISPEYFFNDLNIDENDQNNVQVNAPINIQVTEINKNDLKLLLEFHFLPSIENIFPYLSNSDSKNRAILKDVIKELKEKISTYNKLFEIAKLLKIITITESAKEFVYLDADKYINDTIQDCLPESYRDGLKFESKILIVIVKILALISDTEHINYLIDSRIDYLKRECSFLVDFGIITINENLLEQYKDT